ncbi:unnamed protein product [Allacma fusca]|uniref:Uncharacterized protein n=1 Tax=Allacma fusca TaxID=39272 RepID=A0A8J2LKQ5_9HEXA|nr:unnamed protein product [Allacma fusca]
MFSRIYLVKIFVVSLILTSNQSLEQNYYYNWHQLQPTYSQLVQNSENTAYPDTQNPGIQIIPEPLRQQYYNNAIPSLLPKQETESHSQASDVNSGNGEMQTQGHQSYGYGVNSGSIGSNSYGGYSGVGTGTQHVNTIMKEMKRLGPDGILKILLSVLPFAVCLIFVPSLMITIGLLLIPVIQWGDYVKEKRSLNENLQDKIIENIWKFKV